MAKIFKGAFYLVTDGFIDKKYISYMVKQALNCGILHQFHLEESNEFEVNCYSPEIEKNCDLADLEKHFNHDASIGDVVVGGIYRHFKGHEVKVITVSRGTEYGEQNVVYEHLGDHTIWHRPLSMFCSEVDHDKYPDVAQKYRFELIAAEVTDE